MGVVMRVLKESIVLLLPIFVAVFACLACFYVSWNFGLGIGIAYWVVQSIAIAAAYIGTAEYNRRKNV